MTTRQTNEKDPEVIKRLQKFVDKRFPGKVVNHYQRAGLTLRVYEKSGELITILPNLPD